MNTAAMPPATQLRTHLIDRDAWFTKTCGPSLPTASIALIAHADAAVQQWQSAGHDIAFQSGNSTSWHQGISPKLLPSLASAFRSQPNIAYATLAKAIYQKVMIAEPWHEGWQPEGKFQQLIIPHRLGDTEAPGWFGSLPAFLSCEIFDDTFITTLITSAKAQLNYLKAHMHPGRNIRLTQADALMTQGIMLSILPDAEQWLAQGVHILNDGFNRLIAPDGASREATAWYHAIIMHMAMRLWRLKHAEPKFGLTISAKKIAPMFDYTLACVEPDGKATRIGDTVGDITPDGTLASMIALRKKCLTELRCDTAMPQPAQIFNHVNQAMIRTNWTATADFLTFDATTRYGHHWHPSRNSLQLILQGQRILVDPGRMTYDNTPHRNYALSTRGHSTLNLNSQQQSDAPATLRHAQTNHAQFIDGSYAGGYWPIKNSHHLQGTFARHQRSVLWLQNRFVLVIDHLSHTEGEATKPAVEVMWHYAPGTVTLDAENRLASSTHGPHDSHGSRESNQNVHMNLHALLCPADAKMSLHCGELEPHTLGWVANDKTDASEPAPSVMLRIARQDLWRLDLATLLVPGNQGRQPRAIAHTSSHDASEKPYAHVSVTWDDGSADHFWWTRDLLASLDEVDGIVTDASLLHLHDVAQGNASHLTLIDGSFARALDNSWSVPASDEPGMRSVDL